MEQFIYYIILVALMAAFVLTLLRKWGVIEWVQVHGNEFFAKMFNCDFCLSWWACVLICFFAFVLTGNPAYLGVPFCSTMITRILL
jgi:hypothetical protein|uniref:Uncharacterized protein n=1 Tax=Siphoviridae sp. ctHMI2 TaxID=2826231 RepID=A0A8S5MJP8_9CAUD|nr:MAG: protein of unknown function (DUF1360) [Bacteriophage sp.]DAD82430.1 MAG TPA: Protein of unknown function (DUF1360) [Siphoviridae sp. ctHMI2]